MSENLSLSSMLSLQPGKTKPVAKCSRPALEKLCCAWLLSYMLFTPPKLCPIASWTTGATEATAAVMVPSVVHDLSPGTMASPGNDVKPRPPDQVGRAIQGGILTGRESG